MTFGQLVTHQRKKLKISKQGLARRLGWHRNRISAIEKDQARLLINEVYALSHALDISPLRIVDIFFKDLKTHPKSEGNQ